MRTFDIRVFAVPCDERGRPVGPPKAQPGQRVSARDPDDAKKVARQKLSQGRGRLISLGFRNAKSLVAYVEES